MRRWRRTRDGAGPASDRLRTDGGEDGAGEGDDPAADVEADDSDDDGRPEEGEPGSPDAEDSAGADRADVDVLDAGEAEPAAPEWDRPDPEDIPEFEVRADRPVSGGGGTGAAGAGGPGDGTADPTAGMPNDARSPGGSRIRTEGTEGYVAALELCARLPDDVRLPEEAADLVPAAVEAELEEDVQSFAAAEFDEPTPHVDTLSFQEVDGEVWLRIRLGVAPRAVADLDPAAIRDHALQQLEGLF